ALAALAGGAPRRSRVVVATAALVPAAILGADFPTPGSEPFAASSFWPALALILILAAAVPALRPGAAVYAVVCVAAFAVPTPLGGNAVRLGALFAGPLVAALASRPRLLLLAVPLAYWQLQAPIRDVVVADGDPSTTAAYYAPVERFLAGRPGRVEVPFTREHWEAALLAPRIALARGWERQLDIAVNGLFYRPGLTAAAYGDWLRATGVTYVARPDAELDYSARGEAAVIDAGQPYLRPVATLPHWRVYAVAGALRLAAPARLTELGPDRFVLHFERAGTTIVRLRFTRWWTSASGCVSRAAGGFTAVSAAGPGSVAVDARLSVGALLEREQVCPGEAARPRPAGDSAAPADGLRGAG
ncbi:MAG: hypothetical protein ACR2KV_15585, partial [Solirubrobacteraceae bacterium]